MAFDRIRARWGDAQRDPTYPDDGDYIPPEEYDDPHTTAAESEPSLREQLLEKRWWLLTTSLFIVAALVAALLYGSRYLVTAASNPWVQRGVAGIALVAFGAFARDGQVKSALKGQDELILDTTDSDKPTRYLGEYRNPRGTKYAYFIPYKAVSNLFGSPTPYDAGDLSASLPDDMPARIRLQPMAGVTATDTGRYIVQSTAGVEPDPKGKETNLVATLPDSGDEGTVEDLTKQLEWAETEIGDLEDRIDQLERQRDDAREEAKKTRQEVRTELKNDGEVFAQFVGRRTHATGESDGSSNGHRSTDEVRRDLRREADQD